MLQTIQITAGNVGIIPQQIFTAPHVKRDTQPTDISLTTRMMIYHRPKHEILFFSPISSKNSFISLSMDSNLDLISYTVNLNSETDISKDEIHVTMIIMKFLFKIYYSLLSKNKNYNYTSYGFLLSLVVYPY